MTKNVSGALQVNCTEAWLLIAVMMRLNLKEQKQKHANTLTFQLRYVTCKIRGDPNFMHLRCILVSEVVVIKDPPGDISASTWQAMSLERALVTRNKKLRIRSLCTIDCISGPGLNLVSRAMLARKLQRCTIYHLPAVGWAASALLLFGCIAQLTKRLSCFVWSEPIPFPAKKNTRRKLQIKQR